jgi:rubrerythrin
LDKKSYFVRVAAGEIMDDPTAFDYEFEIKADSDDIDKLQELFEDTAEAETHNAHASVIPYASKIDEEENRLYDDNLKQIYRMLHTLGTPETRKHIETMHIFNGVPEK